MKVTDLLFWRTKRDDEADQRAADDRAELERREKAEARRLRMLGVEASVLQRRIKNSP